PFSDLSQTKLRPALAIADVGRGDWILCQITSKPYGDASALEVKDDHLQRGSLRVISYVRPGKIFTANQGLLVMKIGILKPEKFKEVIEAVIALLQRSLTP